MMITSSSPSKYGVMDLSASSFSLGWAFCTLELNTGEVETSRFSLLSPNFKQTEEKEAFWTAAVFI